MPLTKVDYSKTTIYKIQHKEIDELLYIGSTTDFTRRKAQHKRVCDNANSKAYNFKVYKMIRGNGGFDCFNIIVIKDFPCNTKQEALIEEDRVTRQMKANMNSLRAYVTPDDTKEREKQYRLEHKDEIAERGKQYRLEHKDEIAERGKQYYNQNKEQISEQHKRNYELNKPKRLEQRKQYDKLHKEQRVEYFKRNYELNKEKILEQSKQRYEKIKEQRKQKNTCECGCIIRKDSLPKHLKTKTHQNYLLNMTEQ